jgi:hypothetical protein
LRAAPEGCFWQGALAWQAVRPRGCFWQGALAWQAVRPRGCKGLRLGCAWAGPAGCKAQGGLLPVRGLVRRGHWRCRRWPWRPARAGLAWEGQCAGRGALGARGLLAGWRKGDFFQLRGLVAWRDGAVAVTACARAAGVGVAVYRERRIGVRIFVLFFFTFWLRRVSLCAAFLLCR